MFVDSSGAAQELIPSARIDTRTRMSKKYRRKLEMDITLLHEWIVNLPLHKLIDIVWGVDPKFPPTNAQA